MSWSPRRIDCGPWPRAMVEALQGAERGPCDMPRRVSKLWRQRCSKFSPSRKTCWLFSVRCSACNRAAIRPTLRASHPSYRRGKVLAGDAGHHRPDSQPTFRVQSCAPKPRQMVPLWYPRRRFGLAATWRLRPSHCFYLRNLERANGFEPSTLTLARLCSTPELRPHSKSREGFMAHGLAGFKPSPAGPAGWF